MINEAYYPKKGWFARYDKFPAFGGFSLTLGLSREPVQHCMEGYDKPISHKGFETYLFLCLLDRQFQIGYKTVKKVKR